MKTITKTEWNMMHSDSKMIRNGQNCIKLMVLDENGKIQRKGIEIVTEWVPVKIKGAKTGEKYS
jgi:hypothetical protein